MNADNARVFLDALNTVDADLLDEAEQAAGLDKLIGGSERRRERRPMSPAAIAACVAAVAVVVYLAVLMIGRYEPQIAAFFGRLNEKRIERRVERQDEPKVIRVRDLRNYFFDVYNKKGGLLPDEDEMGAPDDPVDPDRVPQSDRDKLIGQTYSFRLAPAQEGDAYRFCMYMEGAEANTYRLAVVIESDCLPLLLVFRVVPAAWQNYLCSETAGLIEAGGEITGVLVCARNIDRGQQALLGDALAAPAENGTPTVSAADFEAGLVPMRLGAVVGTAAVDGARMYFSDDCAALDRFRYILSAYDLVHVVHDGEPTPEDVVRFKKSMRIVDGASGQPWSWSAQTDKFKENGTQYLAFSGHKKSSVSYWSEGGLCAYTITEMVVDTVLDSSGRFASVAELDVVMLLETYAYAPNGRLSRGTYRVCSADGRSRDLTILPMTLDPVDNSSDYIVVLTDDLQARAAGGTITAQYTGKIVLDADTVDTTFLPIIVRACDASFMAAAVDDSSISDPAARRVDVFGDYADFLYYDLMQLLAKKTGVSWSR